MGFWWADRVLPGVAGAGVVGMLSLTLHYFLHRKFTRRLVTEFTDLTRELVKQTRPQEAPDGKHD